MCSDKSICSLIKKRCRVRLTRQKPSPPLVTSCRGKLAKFGDTLWQHKRLPTCIARTDMKSFRGWSRGVDVIVSSSGCPKRSQRTGKPPPRITWTYFTLTRRVTQCRILNFRLSKERNPNGKQTLTNKQRRKRPAVIAAAPAASMNNNNLSSCYLWSCILLAKSRAYIKKYTLCQEGTIDTNDIDSQWSEDKPCPGG